MVVAAPPPRTPLSPDHALTAASTTSSWSGQDDQLLPEKQSCFNGCYGLSKYGLEPVTVEETDHYKLMREFCADPAGFVEGVMAE